MMNRQRSEMLGPSRFAPAATEDLMLGSRMLRQAFTGTPTRFAPHNAPLIRAGDAEPHAILIRSGFALRSWVFNDGRRSILDVLVTGDICGPDNVLLARSVDEVTAVGRVGYNRLSGDVLRGLMEDRSVSLHLYSLLVRKRCYCDRLAASLGRLDAEARICAMLLDLYERLRQRGLISRASFNLPLTQEQIADHLGLTVVHVNRTLRRLREDKVVLLDRHVVIIMDMDRLRRAAQGLPEMEQPAADADAELLQRD